MNIRASKLIVRLAAVVTGLASISFLYFPTTLAYVSLTTKRDAPDFWRNIGLCALSTFLPLMFVWASVQAWRYVPRGIVSLSSVWVLFGLGGAIFRLFWFVEERKFQGAVEGAVWICVFLSGLLIARQERRFRNDAA